MSSAYLLRKWKLHEVDERARVLTGAKKFLAQAGSFVAHARRARVEMGHSASECSHGDQRCRGRGKPNFFQRRAPPQRSDKKIPPRFELPGRLRHDGREAQIISIQRFDEPWRGPNSQGQARMLQPRFCGEGPCHPSWAPDDEGTTVGMRLATPARDPWAYTPPRPT